MRHTAAALRPTDPAVTAPAPPRALHTLETLAAPSTEPQGPREVQARTTCATGAQTHADREQDAADETLPPPGRRKPKEAVVRPPRTGTHTVTSRLKVSRPIHCRFLCH